MPRELKLDGLRPFRPRVPGLDGPSLPTEAKRPRSANPWAMSRWSAVDSRAEPGGVAGRTGDGAKRPSEPSARRSAMSASAIGVNDPRQPGMVRSGVREPRLRRLTWRGHRVHARDSERGRRYRPDWHQRRFFRVSDRSQC